MIHLGNTAEGKRIEIPVFHTGVFGQTGVGKTRELKYMARQAVEQGFAVLIIDSKLPHPEFKGFGKDIPLYLEESTDADVFRSLIEGMRTEGRGDMNRYRGGFVELCEPFDAPPAANFKEIGDRLEAKMHDKAIKGNTRVMYSEIRRDYLKLMKMLGEHKFSKKLEIPRPIARMETRVLPNVALQGLVLKSVINQMLRQEKDLIILVDEAPNFCNQNLYNPAKSALMALDAQGRSKGLFGWYSGQTLTGFDKKNMKNLWYWVIGREMEPNEAKDAHSVQTYKRLSVDEIRRLAVQEFVAITPESTDKIRVPDVNKQGYLGKEDDEKDKAEDTTEQSTLPVEPIVEPAAAPTVPQSTKQQEITLEMDEEAQAVEAIEDGNWQFENYVRAIVRHEMKFMQEVPSRRPDPQTVDGTQDIVIEERRSKITIERIREPVKFAEDSVEGRLCKMMKAGELDSWRTVPNIAKSIVNAGGEDDEGKVRAAVEAFAKSPYHLLEQRKNPSSRAWEFRLNKEEAEQAFKK